MGFNRRKIEAEQKARLTRRRCGPTRSVAQVLEDVERPIAAWNERQAKRMPMLLSLTIGACVDVIWLNRRCEV
jgi:hypothetical protein